MAVSNDICLELGYGVAALRHMCYQHVGSMHPEWSSVRARHLIGRCACV
jgi:hypothetical protein